MKHVRSPNWVTLDFWLFFSVDGVIRREFNGNVVEKNLPFGSTASSAEIRDWLCAIESASATVFGKRTPAKRNRRESNFVRLRLNSVVASF